MYMFPEWNSLCREQIALYGNKPYSETLQENMKQ